MTNATTEAEDNASNEDRVIEAIPMGDQSTAGNASNYVPIKRITKIIVVLIVMQLYFLLKHPSKQAMRKKVHCNR